MKKILLVLLLLTANLYLLTPPVFADYASAKADYTYQYNQYRSAYDAYLVAKSTFATYKTLTAQATALDKERLVIQARDLVILSYFNLIQEKLNLEPSVDPTYKDTFNGIRASETAWLADHQKKIDAAANFDDLNAAAAEFEGHFPQFDRETKHVFGTIILTRESTLKLTTDEQVAALKDSLGKMRAAGEDTTFYDRGLIDVTNKLNLSNQKYLAAQSILAPKNANQNPIDLFAGQQTLTQANQYLRETVKYLWELVWKITST